MLFSRTGSASTNAKLARTEGVAWNVMAQIAALTAAFAEPNNRPTQKLGARPLAVDTMVSLGG